MSGVVVTFDRKTREKIGHILFAKELMNGLLLRKEKCFFGSIRKRRNSTCEKFWWSKKNCNFEKIWSHERTILKNGHWYWKGLWWNFMKVWKITTRKWRIEKFATGWNWKYCDGSRFWHLPRKWSTFEISQRLEKSKNSKKIIFIL